ncbi:MAG TPA: hypothetical protein PLV62_09990, partial [Spirochaetota bacterium]|nr:hypothetical protein [Spirochaetota bacterium]
MMNLSMSCVLDGYLYRNVKDKKQYDDKKKVSLRLQQIEGGYNSMVAYGSTTSYYNDSTGCMVRF